MPRKKERKSDKNKKKLNLASPLTKAVIDDKEKSLYQKQIGFLNEKLERFQIKCAELEKQNKLLISQYSSLDTEKKDVTEYLKRTLSEKEDEADDLLQRLEAQRQAAVQEKQSLQLKHDKLRQELDAQINELNEKNAVLVKKLVDLEEFQRQKDELMIKLQNLEKQLECQQEKHKDEIHSLEMKDLLEKRKLRLEMESEVAAMSSKVQLLVEQKLPEKIRSVLQENTELKTRLSKLSEATESLLEENTSLRERRRQLSVDNDILEQTVRETSRISCVCRKEVQQLRGKFQQLQEDVSEKQQQLEQLQTEHTRVLADMEALRLDRASLSAEWSSSRMERNQLEVKLKDERRRKNRMRSIMQDAANSLLQVLKEAPTQQQDVDAVPPWRRTLQNLQELLNRQSIRAPSAQRELQKSDPDSTRAERLDPGRSFLSQPSRQKARDSRLLPQPAVKPRDSLCRTGAASSSSLSSLPRKPMILRSSRSATISRSSLGSLTSSLSPNPTFFK
ncbi:PREDICTED: uncharacterized protein C9orf117 homolog [Cyprinodon variegatus]|uniref:uncharacterized protein C9orf117 homolog n=1 Tax=Cyprinodon variegatus TaxID=28743 RepID=UPI000742AD57|nr:PREDICTED: uncharacterized protein C9orf117 homolog [Cyprinodon variegatus]